MSKRSARVDVRDFDVATGRWVPGGEADSAGTAVEGHTRAGSQASWRSARTRAEVDPSIPLAQPSGLILLTRKIETGPPRFTPPACFPIGTGRAPTPADIRAALLGNLGDAAVNTPEEREAAVDAITPDGLFVPYSDGSFGLTEDWCHELSGTQEQKLALAMVICRNNTAFLPALVTLLNLFANLPARLLSGLTETVNNSTARLTNTAGAILSGYTDPMVIGLQNVGNPWIRMVWMDSPVRNLMGMPARPCAFTFPLNWPAASESGLATRSVTVNTDGTMTWDTPFAFPDSLSNAFTDVGRALNGADAMQELTAVGVAALVRPGIATVSALVANEADALGESFIDTGIAHRRANDALSAMFEGFADFLDANRNPVAWLWDSIVSGWDLVTTAINTAIDLLGGDGNIRDLRYWDEKKNVLTNLDHDDTTVLAFVLDTANIGTIYERPVTVSGEDVEGGWLPIHFGIAEVRIVPITQLDEGVVNFEFTNFRALADDGWYRLPDGTDVTNWYRATQPLREAADLINLASILVEQSLCIDDAIAASSGLVLKPNTEGVLATLLGSGAAGLLAGVSCLDELLLGRSLPALLRILWRLHVTDVVLTFLEKVGYDGACMVPNFCPVDATRNQASSRATIGYVDLVLGPRTPGFEAGTFGLFPGRNIMPVLNAAGVPQSGLLFVLLQGGALTCADRLDIKQFFQLQDQCSTCPLPRYTLDPSTIEALTAEEIREMMPHADVSRH